MRLQFLIIILISIAKLLSSFLILLLLDSHSKPVSSKSKFIQFQRNCQKFNVINLKTFNNSSFCAARVSHSFHNKRHFFGYCHRIAIRSIASSEATTDTHKKISNNCWNICTYYILELSAFYNNNISSEVTSTITWMKCFAFFINIF